MPDIGDGFCATGVCPAKEEIVPLFRPHEKIVVSPDGRIAVLTGGYLPEGGWDRLTLIDLQTHVQREFAVPAHPLDAVVLGR